MTLSGPNGIKRKQVTDREGRFRASGLPPGEYSIAANVPQTIRVNGDLRVRLADRGCATTAIHLISNGRVEGRVVDGAGESVARAFVSLMPAAYTNQKEFPHAWVRNKSSGLHGEFAFDGLPPGECHVGVNVQFGARPDAPYGPVWLPNVAARTETMPVRLSDGERRSDLEIVVGARLREVTIQGVVLKPDGTAAEGAHVAHLAPGTRIATTTGNTDAYGAFALKGLERTPYVVEASVQAPAGRRTSAAATVTVTNDDPVRLRLTLATASALPNSPR